MDIVYSKYIWIFLNFSPQCDISQCTCVAQILIDLFLCHMLDVLKMLLLTEFKFSFFHSKYIGKQFISDIGGFTYTLPSLIVGSGCFYY